MRSSIRPLLQSLVSLLFVVILLLPGFQMVTRRLPAFPLEENRTLAAAPTRSQLATPSVFLEQAQKWFDDHYGLRDILIRLKTQIDYSVFDVSDKVHIGRDGWLFYRSVIDHEEPEVERLTDAELHRIVDNFARLRDVLAGRGIRLVIMTNQLGDTFYPENLPRTAWRARDRHRFADFRALLHQLPGVTYIDTTDRLMALTRQGQTFHKTDFHWNEPTAAVFAGTLVDTIAGLEHRDLPFWRSKTRVTTKPFSGGEAMFMPLFVPPSENGSFIERTEAWSVDGAPGSYPFESVWTAKPGVTGLLPPMVMYSDSFSDGMEKAGLYDFFERSLRARTYRAKISDIVAQTPPGTKYFIFQFIEVGLPMLRDMPVD